ncbi:dihydrolipoamide acetyltransferase family protein [Marinobacter confluentis]|uniref:Dihydrolipoamide acetyltransferase component of pyruvate dehydrogenase complex n=1 Tax=Marinobacter confluentis TaxID=1697557 RepID=A0A4Z1CB51_9GAMM|nr:dihydrolipoamide acetyltransferase family protein [Marinobacter confluentis]TGN41113.1 2-oxo acid dehydrogenase subunit E2 [Marinobacter confluentis]
MKNFKLPDLGEGLPEAEIVEWHVNVGDTVEVDQVLVSVETAKAIVEVPSPEAGTVAKLYGQPGDIIHTGEPLMAYEGEGNDSGTVVGELKRADTGTSKDNFIIGAAESSKRARANRASYRARSLPDAELLRGTRRTMAKNMAASHSQVVPVSIFEDVDIDDWKPGTDITMRLVQAIARACETSPVMNSWFDGETLSRRLKDEVHIGIAVDTPEGLFVPVLRDVNHRTADDLRQGLQNLREAVATRKIPPAEMQGATITLSNFGTMTGQYANPIVSPPQVAIIGAGVIREKVVPHNGKPAVRRVLPLSVTFDHRAATGGEASRFLGALIDELGTV